MVKQQISKKDKRSSDIEKILEWDSDFTKLTPDERRRVELAEQEIEAGEAVSHEDIDWD